MATSTKLRQNINVRIRNLTNKNENVKSAERLTLRFGENPRFPGAYFWPDRAGRAAFGRAA
jgi:hypothetical protein